MSVADRLREAREKMGTSTRELDVAAGLTPGHTYLIESGRRSRIELETASKLAGALGVTVDWLLGGPASTPALPDSDDDSSAA